VESMKTSLILDLLHSLLSETTSLKGSRTN